jgi:drug/metabolite transporter (DMT)-like permease
MRASSPTSLRADLVLVAVTFVWGSSFVIVKDLYETAPPLAFLSLRFLLALVVLAAIAILFRRRPTPGIAKDGGIVGALLATGLALQVIGIPETTASNAAFVTGLSVPLTPLASWIRTRRLPTLENGIGLALAAGGFVLMTFPAGLARANRGDLVILVAAFIFAFHLVELGERTGRQDPVWMTGAQIACVAALAGVLTLLLPLLSIGDASVREARPVVWSSDFVRALLYLGTLGTVGTFFGMTWAQRHMPATHAAILFALEPVFAALLAAIFLHERLGGRGIVGAVLVLAGIVVSELRFSRRPAQSSANGS